MGSIAIVVYQPKPGKEAPLRALVDKHCKVLAAESLITARPPCVMRSASGAFVEVLEWRSSEAIDQAHRNPSVQALWAEFAEACDYVPLANLDEAKSLFAGFEPA
jgi:hypothetical protein